MYKHQKLFIYVITLKNFLCWNALALLNTPNVQIILQLLGGALLHLQNLTGD